MFQDSIECYQTIGSALANAAKTPWDTIAVEVTLDGVRVDVAAACWRESDTSPVAYLTGVPRLASYFYDLARLVSTKEKGLFKKCRFTLERNEKFDVDFDCKLKFLRKVSNKGAFVFWQYPSCAVSVGK